MEPLRLVVLGDSTSFTDDRGPQLPGADTVYPTLLAKRLEKELDRPVVCNVLARAGQTVRDAARLVTKDRHVQFEVLPQADAIVVGVASFDHAPGGVPPSVEAVVPYLRPAWLRQRARLGLRWSYPWLVRATAGRIRRTPAAEFERLYDLLLLQLRGLTQGGAAGVVLGPTSHRSPYYAHTHPRHAEAQAQTFAIAQRHGFATVACWPHVEARADALNPDGIHWPPDVHAAVADDLADALIPQLAGSTPRPPSPTHV